MKKPLTFCGLDAFTRMTWIRARECGGDRLGKGRRVWAIHGHPSETGRDRTVEPPDACTRTPLPHCRTGPPLSKEPVAALWNRPTSSPTCRYHTPEPPPVV